MRFQIIVLITICLGLTAGSVAHHIRSGSLPWWFTLIGSVGMVAVWAEAFRRPFAGLLLTSAILDVSYNLSWYVAAIVSGTEVTMKQVCGILFLIIGVFLVG